MRVFSEIKLKIKKENQWVHSRSISRDYSMWLLTLKSMAETDHVRQNVI